MSQELSIALISAGATAVGVIIAGMVGLITKVVESRRKLKEARFEFLKEKFREIEKEDPFLDLTKKVVSMQTKLSAGVELSDTDVTTITGCSYSLRKYYPYLSKGLRKELTNVLKKTEFQKGGYELKSAGGLRAFMVRIIRWICNFFEVLWWGKSLEDKLDAKDLLKLFNKLRVYYGRFC